MAIKLTLSSKKILEKVFPGVDKGYDPLLVDEFLDQVLNDYRNIEDSVVLDKKQYETMMNKIAELESKVKDLEIDNEKYRIRFTNIKDNDNVTLDNIELVKKINRYETFLYNHGYNPHTIK